MPVPAADAPRVLVSVDRTLWNRLGINRLTWVRTLRNAGVRPVLVDFSRQPPGAGAAAAWLDEVDGLILSGGGDVAPMRYGDAAIRAEDVSAERDAFELALLAAAEARGMPILGVCRGAQLINVYRGGTLGDFRADGDRYDRHHRLPPGHAVTFEPDSRLAEIFGTQKLDSVVTWHGQHVAEPGAGVSITGRAPDGTPEAIEVHTGSRFGMLGVQWHAEIAPWDGHQQRLFDAFAAGVERHARTKAANSRR
ncbi:MAG: gamma-glutamyl-gamma-aminobutyrate hydrolase family protein [Woeseiaceae bacterium]|nr:gamma-glutamyl-gamma-aminobutyrate hydrolase family protein [Woeseiaceae bacterium]